ncbi:MAG: PstS family phosphate ABC transporter substrate-binding protein [Chitinispirillaceae bacterium]|nr:PstS family phosphate ABC transporter substrate-binding protein [Chitinispirillaceae bacterium]
MRRMQWIMTIGAVIFTAATAPYCVKSEVKNLRIFGSTTVEPFMKQAVAEYGKTRTVQFQVRGVGSKDGIDSLIAGACDMAMSSTEILPEQTARAQKNGMHLKPFLLGYDIIVPIVHPSNTISVIPFDALKRVFEGKLVGWSALGGADTAIDVVDRSDASGTYAVWHHYVAPPMATEERVTVRPSNSSVLAYVSEHTNAIGYVSNAYLNPEVKPLKLDGIAIAESDSMLSEYHLKRPLYLYVDEDRFNDDLKAFVIFMIISERGRALLREAGFFSDFSIAPLEKAVENISKR